MSNDSQPVTKKQRPWGLILSIAAVALIALILLLAEYSKHSSQQKIQQALAKLKAQGQPVTGTELDAWYPEPPPSENAAQVYQQAFNNEVGIPPKGVLWNALNNGTSSLFKETRPLDPALQKALTDYLQTNRTALRYFHEGARLSKARYPVSFISGFSTLLPHLTKIKDGSQLLRLEALSHTVENRPEAAVAASTAALQLGHSLANEPTLISFLVQCACYNITCESVKNCLNRHAFPPESLKTLAAGLESAETSLHLQRAMVGERANGMGIFTMSVDQINTMMLSTPTSWERIGFSLYESSGLRQKDLQIYLKYLNRYVEASTNQNAQLLTIVDQIEQDADKELTDNKLGTLLTGLVLPALSKVPGKKLISQANLRLTRVAALIHAYQAEHHGQLPEKLADLAPDYLTDVPLDPFDGKPLRYQHDGDSFKIWSIGLDQIDQGGQVPAVSVYQSKGDIVFTNNPALAP